MGRTMAPSHSPMVKRPARLRYAMQSPTPSPIGLDELALILAPLPLASAGTVFSSSPFVAAARHRTCQGEGLNLQCNIIAKTLTHHDAIAIRFGGH